MPSTTNQVIDITQDIVGLEKQLRKNMKRHRCIQIVVFLIVIGLDIADLLSDWLFYADVSIAEQGLVYGVPERGAVIALLVFSIIGSVGFMLETANLLKEVYSGKPWVNIDLMSAVILWVEDVPQITINVVIAICREDPISIFQLSKACVVIIAIFVRIVMAFVKYCKQDAIEELSSKSRSSRFHVICRVFIVLGLLLNFAGASTVFFFTQTQRDANGKIYFEVPDTILHDRFNDERYFKNVSIYFHHPTFDVKDKPNVTEANWMRLITINSVRDLPDYVVMFSYEYQHTDDELKMLLWEYTTLPTAKTWSPAECYTIDKHNATMTKGSNCATFLDPNLNRTSIIFKFAFTPPDRIFRKLVFGDIKFNAKYSDSNGFCDFISADNITDNIEDGLQNSIDVTVHYYRTMVSETNHVVAPSGSDVRFYRQDDLIDIKEVWETGWFYCETTGSIAPHIDESIDPPCNIIL